MVTMLVMTMAMFTGCGTELNQTNNEKKEVAIEWENVFEAMERYDMEANGYYVSSTYKEDVDEMNYVAVYSEAGELLDEEGIWFLKEDKEVIMQEKVEDAQEMFAL